MVAESLQGEASNSVLVNVKKEHVNLSNSPEALINLERSYLQGFISGSAWRDGVISSMQSSNSFRAGPDCLRFNNNLWRFEVLRNESLDKAIDWLALHMTSDQTPPRLIFSNWDNLELVTKNYIINSAQNKSQMPKSYDWVSVSISISLQVCSVYRNFLIYVYGYDSTGC